MTEPTDPYACNCGEGRLRPVYVGGNENAPAIGCTACGEYTEPDPDHPDADPAWRATVLELYPPGDSGDPEEGMGESTDALDETPEENLARLEATLGFRPLPIEPF